MARKTKRKSVSRRSSASFKLPRELTTVTPLSKAVAFIAFVTIPVIAFMYGMRLQQSATVDTTTYTPPTSLNLMKKDTTPSPSPKAVSPTTYIVK